jgi:hypothetical protein
VHVGSPFFMRVEPNEAADVAGAAAADAGAAI